MKLSNLNRFYQLWFMAVLVLVSLCLMMFTFIFIEELNIKQIERQNLELIRLQEIEKLKYFKTLNFDFG